MPFHLNAGGAKVTRQVRQQMVDEVMYRLSALLPPPYRGVYAHRTVRDREEYLSLRPT